jgi:hypothetical protein
VFVFAFVVVGASDGGDDDDDGVEGRRRGGAGEGSFCDAGHGRGRLAGMNGSASTDLSTRRPNGSVNSERRLYGSGCNPCDPSVRSCKNLFRAAGDARGV